MAVTKEKAEQNNQITHLKIQIKHLTNELRLTKEEYENASKNYFDIYSNMERTLRSRVTKLKKMDKMFKKKSQQMQIMLDFSPAMIFYKDVKKKYLRVNKQFSRTLGIPIKNIIGKTYADLFPNSTDNLLEDDSEVIQKGKPVLNRSGFLERLQGQIEVRIDKIPFKDIDDNVIGLIGVVYDVTELRRAQQELENAKMTAEMSLKETKQQLLQAQKLESVGRLAGGIAHDFNNMLTTIIGYSELIFMEQGLNETVNEGVQEIKKSAERAASLTQQLLAFSRKQIMRPQQIDLNKLIKNLRKMLTRLIHEDITFSTKLNTGIGEIKADPVQIEQVIMNLVVNARDAMPDGGTLTIETQDVYLDESYRREQPEVIPGDYVLLMVSDTGHGIDSETIKNIFDPFFTTKELGQGTGLGLSTVYGIVKQSGGYIWVYSELDQGTTFKIYLPKITEHEKYQESLLEKSLLGKQEPMSGSEMVLLVEDEESLRKMIFRILKKYGYSIIEAADGVDALAIIEKADQLKIDLLVTDVIMPKMSGKKLSERLLERYPESKVLYISGYTDNTIVHHGVLDEGVSFLQKPFSPQSLAQKVREVLDED